MENQNEILLTLKRVEQVARESLEYSHKAFEAADKVRRHLLWSRIYYFIKLGIVLAIIAFLFVFVPPLVKNLIAPYSKAFNQINQIQNGGIKVDQSLINSFLGK